MAKSKKSKAPATGTAKGPGGKRGAAQSAAAAAAPASAAISAAPAKAQPKPETPRKPTPEQVSARAHQIWIDAGKPQGLALEHWLRAERELSK